MLVSYFSYILQGLTSTHEVADYSEESTQEPSSWAGVVNDHDIEGERFEICSQESRTDFGSS